MESSASASTSAASNSKSSGRGSSGGAVAASAAMDDDGLPAIELATLLATRLSTLRSLHRIQSSSLGPSHPASASTLLSIGSLLMEMNEYDSALGEMECAIDILKQSLGNSHPELGRGYMTLGGAYERRCARGDDVRALEAYGGAAGAFEETMRPIEDREGEGFDDLLEDIEGEAGTRAGKPNPELGEALNASGLVHLRLENHDDAMEMFVAASEAYGMDSSDSDESLPSDPALADVWSNIAKLRHAAGENDEALDAYDFALEVLETARGEAGRGAGGGYGNDRGAMAVRDAYHFAMGIMGEDDACIEEEGKQGKKEAKAKRKGKKTSSGPPKAGDRIKLSGNASVVSELTMDNALKSTFAAAAAANSTGAAILITSREKSLREIDLRTAGVLSGMGTVQLELRSIDAANASLDDALRLLRSHPDGASAAGASSNNGGAAIIIMAEVLEGKGDLDDMNRDWTSASDHYGDALDLVRRRSATKKGEKGDEARLLHKLGSAQMGRRRWNDAILSLRESARLYRKNGTKEGDPTLLDIHAELREALTEEKALHPPSTPSHRSSRRDVVRGGTNDDDRGEGGGAAARRERSHGHLSHSEEGLGERRGGVGGRRNHRHSRRDGEGRRRSSASPPRRVDERRHEGEGRRRSSASPPQRRGDDRHDRRRHRHHDRDHHRHRDHDHGGGRRRRSRDEAYALDQEAESLRRDGKYDEAFEVCKRALQIRMAREGNVLPRGGEGGDKRHSRSSAAGGGGGGGGKTDKIDIARTLRNMAYLYGKRGEVESARVLYDKALGIYRRNGLGDDHPYVEAIFRDSEKLERSARGHGGGGRPLA
uniref:MalT-like TPR region domain-containing protein n=1 Tax=Odontella aurita TaxID=265563 RepID=A0A7S4HZ19_9STRA